MRSIYKIYFGYGMLLNFAPKEKCVNFFFNLREQKLRKNMIVFISKGAMPSSGPKCKLTEWLV